MRSATCTRARVATLAVYLAIVPSAPHAAYAQTVWTRTAPVYALAGAGDILTASTAGGVVLWDLSSGRMQHATTAQGLPTQLVLSAAIVPDGDALYAATANGMARGWFDGGWQARGARTDERGVSLSACLALPAGRAFAGGVGGQLFLWHGSLVDSLRIPTQRGRVVALALFTSWIDATHRAATQDLAKTGEPRFPLGLAAALDNDGVWLLRSTDDRVRWLRFVQEDGLPSHRVRHILTDSQGRLWVATDRGVAWIAPDLGVHAFPTDVLLAQRTHVLLEGADGALYVGLDTGLARVSLDTPEAGATLVPGIPGPVVALARTVDELWTSDGEHVTSSAGRDLALPTALADNYCLALLSTPDAEERSTAVWVGHPFGTVSLRAHSGWSRYGVMDGLPVDDITSFLRGGDSLFAGTATAGLFVGQARTARVPRIDHASVHTAMAGQPHFAPVAGAPTQVSSQCFARGVHWVGGANGLVARRGSTWEPFTLWQGATQVVDIAAAAETLWVSAAHAGLAYHDGRGWNLPACSIELVGAYFGRLSRAADGRIAVATNRGLALWNGCILQRVSGSPDAFVLDVAWWNADIAVGTHAGLWLRHADGSWQMRGVLEGLPGAQVRALDVDAEGQLWVGTTRGLGRFRTFPAEATSLLRLQRTLRISEGLPSQPEQNTSPLGSHQSSVMAVYDVRGRFVRRLEPDLVPGVLWDGRDAEGHNMARGIYFVRPMHALGPGAARKLVLE